MPVTADGRHPRLPDSDLSAEQLLAKLLELIIDADDVDAITDAVVEKAFHAQLDRLWPDSMGYAARLTDSWNYRVEVSDDEALGHGIALQFFDRDGDRRAAMSEICGLDSDTFAEVLINAGFERRTLPGVHGGVAGDFLTRGQLRVTTSVRGEAAEAETVAHRCITGVQVQRRE